MGRRQLNSEERQGHSETVIPFGDLARVLKVLRQRYTIEMVIDLARRETMRHKDFLETVPNTTLSYRLRDLKEAGLITSRPAALVREYGEYYLTTVGRDTAKWLQRTQRSLASPGVTKKIDEFPQIGE